MEKEETFQSIAFYVLFRERERERERCSFILFNQVALRAWSWIIDIYFDNMDSPEVLKVLTIILLESFYI